MNGRKRYGVLLVSALLAVVLAAGGWLIYRENGRAAKHVRYAENGVGLTESFTEQAETEELSGSGGREGAALASGAENLQGSSADAGASAGSSSPAAGSAGTDAADSAAGEAGSGDAADSAAGEVGSGDAADSAAGETGPENTAENGEITLLFAGDVYFSEHVTGAYDRAGDISGVLDEGIRAEIEAADIFMVNQEFPFTSRGSAAENKQFTFRLPPERVSMLQEMGVDIVTMANNHILDFGPEGITDSLAALDGAGIVHVGVGEDLEQAKKLEILEVKGKKIGFLGTCRVYMSASWAAGENHPGVFSTYDSSLPLQEIKAARELCDYLVVYVHWGIERKTEPEQYQRSMGRQYIDAGADLVVGSHPHVLQEIEYYEGKPIVYSLGNFVFGSSIPETELLKVVLRDEAAAPGAQEAPGSGEDAEGAGQKDWYTAEVSTIPCTSSGGYTKLR